MRHYDIDDLGNRDPGAVARFCALVRRTLIPYHQADVRGLDRVPDGAALYVGNHNASIYTPDTYIFCVEAFTQRGMDGLPYGLMHEWLLDRPVINQVLSPLGAVRASHENADRILARGQKVLVYPGGDVEAMRTYRDRYRVSFDGRRGFVRLALRNRVPMVPVVTCGAHASIVILRTNRDLASRLGLDRSVRLKVLPLMLVLPWGLTVGPPMPFVPFPSQITISVLDPVVPARSGPEAAADDSYVAELANHIEAEMQTTMDALAAERRGRGWLGRRRG